LNVKTQEEGQDRKGWGKKGAGTEAKVKKGETFKARRFFASVPTRTQKMRSVGKRQVQDPPDERDWEERRYPETRRRKAATRE